MEPEQFVDKIPTGGLKYVLKKIKELFFKKIQNEAILKWCLQEENKKLKSFIDKNRYSKWNRGLRVDILEILQRINVFIKEYGNKKQKSSQLACQIENVINDFHKYQAGNVINMGILAKIEAELSCFINGM